jgi:hydrogenase expression/formation protein HypE
VADGWTCPLPFRDHDRVTLGHGGGGVLTAELVEHLILPGFGDAAGDATVDAAVLELPVPHPPSNFGGSGSPPDPNPPKLAFTTDAYVVRPLEFPGGDIGSLAVNGTVNDLAMSGAQPLALSAGFVLEEGLEVATLHRIATSMGEAATAAGVTIEAGDTKVVEAGNADGMYITTAGVGIVPPDVDIRPDRATAGDVIIVSGKIGEHGIAVLSQRDGLGFGTELESDTAALNGLVATMLDTCPDVHVLRDLTRGGLAAAFCEIASTADVGMRFDEALVPVPGPVAAACGFLGLDPTHVANEGKLVAIVPAAGADAVVGAMRAHPHGEGAVVIGTVTDEHPGTVVCRTPLGASRIVDRPLGEQLPRIC